MARPVAAGRGGGVPSGVIGHPPFPISVDQLDNATLSAVLDVEVTSFTTTRIGADRGMLGEIFVVEPTYAAGFEGVDRLVAKFAALRDGSLASARRGGTHERELRCYAEFLADTPVNAPSVYGAWYDPSTAHFLLLQDLVEADESVDQIAGLSIDQARLVLRQAARLHARWWLNDDLAATGWLPALDSDQRIHNLTTIASAGWSALVATIDDELTDSEKALGGSFPARLEAALRSIAAHPSTLLHCDLRADNLLFAPDGSEVTIIDWQGAGTGPPSFDLAYFLSQSLSVEVRRTHEDELVEFYRTELADCGVQLTESQVRAGYGESMHYGLAIACALPLISDPKERRVRDLARTVARRSIEAMRDHDQLWETTS